MTKILVDVEEIAGIIKKRYLEIAMSYPNYPEYNKDNHRLKLLVLLANDYADYFEREDKLTLELRRREAGYIIKPFNKQKFLKDAGVE